MSESDHEQPAATTTTTADSGLTEARAVMTRAALAATLLLVLKFVLYGFSRSLLVGADTLVTLVCASALAALALNLRGRHHSDESTISRPAILASSLSAWGIIIGTLVLLWRTVQHLFFSPPDSAEQIAAATQPEIYEPVWVLYPTWALWLEVVLALMGIALLVYVVRGRGLLPGRGLGDAASLISVVAGVSVAAAVGLGLHAAIEGDWLDALLGLLVGLGGFGVLWMQVWKHFNRFVGSHPTTT